MSPTGHSPHCEEYQLPDLEAALASTLALMTGHAEATAEPSRQMLGARVAAQLALLEDHPDLSTPFRGALRSLRGHWLRLQIHAGGTPPSAADALLWHAALQAVQ